MVVSTRPAITSRGSHAASYRASICSPGSQRMADHNLCMPPFRAEHIGSLLRPKRLVEGGLVEGGEDEAIARVIRWQERLGLKVVTDGEFRRESWRLGFVTKVEGFVRGEAIGEVDVQRDAAGNTARVGSAPVAVAKLRRTGPIVRDRCAVAW